MNTSEPKPYGGRSVAPRHRQEGGTSASGPSPQTALPPVLVRLPGLELTPASSPPSSSTHQPREPQWQDSSAALEANATASDSDAGTLDRDQHRSGRRRGQPDVGVNRAGPLERWRALSLQLGGTLLAVALLAVVLLALLRGGGEGPSSDRTSTWDDQVVATTPPKVELATEESPSSQQPEPVQSGILSAADDQWLANGSHSDSRSHGDFKSSPLMPQESRVTALNFDSRPSDLSDQQPQQIPGSNYVSSDGTWDAGYGPTGQEGSPNPDSDLDDSARFASGSPSISPSNRDLPNRQDSLRDSAHRPQPETGPDLKQPSETGRAGGEQPSLGYVYPDTNYPAAFSPSHRVAGATENESGNRALRSAERTARRDRSTGHYQRDSQQAPVHLNRNIEPLPTGSNEYNR